jgi:hypothetical protein
MVKISLSPEPNWEKADVEVIREKEPEMATKKPATVGSTFDKPLSDYPDTGPAVDTSSKPSRVSLADRLRNAARRSTQIASDRSIVMTWTVTNKGMKLHAYYGDDTCHLYLNWIEIGTLDPHDDDPFVKMEIRAVNADAGLKL